MLSVTGTAIRTQRLMINLTDEEFEKAIKEFESLIDAELVAE